MSKVYKTYKLKKGKRSRKLTRKSKSKSLIFDASKVHPASIQLPRK